MPERTIDMVLKVLLVAISVFGALNSLIDKMTELFFKCNKFLLTLNRRR